MKVSPLMKEIERENPLQFLKNRKKKHVRVVLKWNMFYEGELDEFDDYLNIVLRETKEFTENEFTGKVGHIVIRCNNIKLIEEIIEE